MRKIYRFIDRHFIAVNLIRVAWLLLMFGVPALRIPIGVIEFTYLWVFIGYLTKWYGKDDEK